MRGIVDDDGTGAFLIQRRHFQFRQRMDVHGLGHLYSLCKSSVHEHDISVYFRCIKIDYDHFCSLIN